MNTNRITWMPRELRISLRLLATCWLLALVLLLAACGGGGEEAEACDRLEAAHAAGSLAQPYSREITAALRYCGITPQPGTQPVNCTTNPGRCK